MSDGIHTKMAIPSTPSPWQILSSTDGYNSVWFEDHLPTKMNSDGAGSLVGFLGPLWIVVDNREERIVQFVDVRDIYVIVSPFDR